MAFRDNKQFWESFILSYKTYPCLWNVKSKEYANKQKRNEAYQALVEKCKDICPEADVKYVRKKIDSLRAGFRRELREIRKTKRTGTSADSVYEPTLWYFDLLLFTQDQEEVRPGTSSIALEESGTDDDEAGQSGLIREDTVSPLTPSSSSSERKGNTKFAVKDSTLAQKKAKFLDAASAALTVVPPATSPYEPFGKSIACDLENMEARQRIFAQKIISDIVYYGKLGQLTENCSFSVPTNMPQMPLYPYYPHQQHQERKTGYYSTTSVSHPAHTQFPGQFTPVPPSTAEVYTQPTQYTPAPLSSREMVPLQPTQFADRSSCNVVGNATTTNELSEFISFNNSEQTT